MQCSKVHASIYGVGSSTDRFESEEAEVGPSRGMGGASFMGDFGELDGGPQWGAQWVVHWQVTNSVGGWDGCSTRP